MEFALEMVVKATNNELQNRGSPHHAIARWQEPAASSLRSWRDGWRSLRFYLLFSPRWLFLYPRNRDVSRRYVGDGLAVAGAADDRRGQFRHPHTSLCLGGCNHRGTVGPILDLRKIYGMREGLVPPDPWFSSLINSIARIENGLIEGGLLLLIGLGLGFYAVGSWGGAGFGKLIRNGPCGLSYPRRSQLSWLSRSPMAPSSSAFSKSAPLRPKSQAALDLPPRPHTLDARLR